MNSNLDGKSFNPQEILINRLKQDFPEVFSEDSIVDFEKLKATLGESLDFEREKYGLSWAGKSDCFREIQKTTTATLIPEKDKSVNFDETENIFIEGENLEVLRVLQKSYYGKVKMIYIDPPYNTGNDFIYNDKFRTDKKEYQETIGERDIDGNLTKDSAYRKNSKDNGHYHSDWLNMMYPRLFLARNLLRRDGVIFVSIDDNEVHNLRMVMNEIFGEENFVGLLVKQSKVGGGSDTRYIVSEHEYILSYAKDINQLDEFYVEHNPDYLERYKETDAKGSFFWDTFARPGLKNPIKYEIEAPDGTKIPGEWIRSEERFLKDKEEGWYMDGSLQTKVESSR